MPKLTNLKTKEEHELAGEVTRIGRHPSCHIRVVEKQVSRDHCRIVRSKAGWSLIDSGSKLGTYLNGEFLTRHQALRTGDKIKVGTAVFVFDQWAGLPRGEVSVHPMSKASSEEFLPGDVVEPRRRVTPVVIGGLVAALAVGALAAVLVLTRQTPGRVVRQAAELLRRRDAKGLWELVSAEQKAAMGFEQFQERIADVPDEVLEALPGLEVGGARRAERGMVVPVTLQFQDKRLADEVVLFREEGEWKIHSVPAERLAELGIERP